MHEQLIITGQKSWKNDWSLNAGKWSDFYKEYTAYNLPNGIIMPCILSSSFRLNFTEGYITYSVLPGVYHRNAGRQNKTLKLWHFFINC